MVLVAVLLATLLAHGFQRLAAQESCIKISVPDIDDGKLQAWVDDVEVLNGRMNYNEVMYEQCGNFRHLKMTSVPDDTGVVVAVDVTVGGQAVVLVCEGCQKALAPYRNVRVTRGVNDYRDTHFTCLDADVCTFTWPLQSMAMSSTTSSSSSATSTSLSSSTTLATETTLTTSSTSSSSTWSSATSVTRSTTMTKSTSTTTSVTPSSTGSSSTTMTSSSSTSLSVTTSTTKSTSTTKTTSTTTSGTASSTSSSSMMTGSTLTSARSMTTTSSSSLTSVGTGATPSSQPSSSMSPTASLPSSSTISTSAPSQSSPPLGTSTGRWTSMTASVTGMGTPITTTTGSALRSLTSTRSPPTAGASTVTSAALAAPSSSTSSVPRSSTRGSPRATARSTSSSSDSSSPTSTSTRSEELSPGTEPVVPPPAAAEVAGQLFSAVEEASRRLLAGLEETAVVALPDGGTLAISKLGHATENGISVEMPGPVDVSLPAGTFASLGVDSSEMAIVTAAFDASSTSVAGLGSRADADKGGEHIEVASLAVIELRDLNSGSSLDVNGLIEPISFVLPGNFSPGITCAYWDDQAHGWSTNGVWTSTSNEVGGRIECQTTHLSLFGGIIRSILETLACMNVLNMLNAEAMKEILGGSWLTSMGAAMVGGFFTMLGGAFAVAAFLDHWRWKVHHWQDAFLMVYKPASGTTVPATNGGGMCMGGLCMCCLWVQESDVLRQALDDIVSSWFEYFGDVRTAIESCIDCIGTDLAAIGTGIFSGQLSALTHKVAAKTMIFAARRNTAAHLFMNPELVSLVLDDEDLADYLLEQNAHSGGVNWRRNSSQAEAWAGLREEISHYTLQNIRKQGRRRRMDYLKSVIMLCLAENPIGALFVHDILRSCKMRVFLFSAEMLGALAVSCLFFERAGMVKGKLRGGGGCPTDDNDDGFDAAKTIGRFFVISLGCLLVAGIPVHMLSSLQTKCFKVMSEPPGSEAWAKQLRAWRLQERMVAVLTTLYSMLCTFYIVTFVANIGSAEHTEWSTTGALAIFQDVLLLPFMTALVVPMAAQAILALHLRISRACRERFTREVCEIFHDNSNAMLPIERL